jgi:hypothetical protein
MATKRYVSTTGMGISFPVLVAGKRKWVSLDGNRADFTTSDVELQAAIENHREFKSRQIILANSKPDTATIRKENANIPIAEKSSQEPVDEPVSADEIPDGVTEYPDVTDINGAKSVLRGEPYNIHHMKLQTPQAIREQAELNKVSFPNWPTE